MNDRPPRDSWTVTIEGAAGTAIVGAHCAVLVHAEPGHAFVASLSGPVLAGSGVCDALAGLDGHASTDHPAFGAIERTGDGWTLVLSGAVEAEVTGTDQLVSIHRSPGASRWHELPVQRPRDVTLSIRGGDGDSSFGLALGLAPATRLSIAFPLATEGPPSTAAIGAMSDGGPVEVAPEVTPDDLRQSPELDFHHLFVDTSYRSGATSDAADDADGPREPGGHAQQPASAPIEPALDPADPTTQIFEAPAPDPEVTGLPAPPQPPAAPGGLIDWVPGASAPPAGQVPVSFDPPPAVPAPAAAPRLDALPPPPVAPPASAPPPPPPDPIGDPPPPGARPGSPIGQPAPASTDLALEDATITIAALRAAQAGAGATSGEPTVTALMCPTGHPNPTHNDRCRSCGTAITDRTTHTIARPTLGRLRFADGNTAVLDRHLLIGRNPSRDVMINDEPTGVIKLADPDSVLSRTHVAVQLDGWQVKIIDRDSMNHTFVEIPGRPPFQIRPGEPYPIPPGSTVRLGDEVGFVFETDLT